MRRALSQKRKFLLVIIIGVAGLGLVAVTAFQFWTYFQTTHVGPTTPSSSQTVTQTGPVSERPVTVSSTGYTVPTGQPRTIQIPKLGINAYVQRVGVTKDGAMATPNNINFTGWYTGSPVPGERGVSIINGHAGGRYTAGVFRTIRNLKPGDTIIVQMGDMSTRTFAVVSTATYALADVSKPLFNDDTSIDDELHLITCDGIYNDQQQSYDKRTIVVAKYLH